MRGRSTSQIRKTHEKLERLDNRLKFWVSYPAGAGEGAQELTVELEVERDVFTEELHDRGARQLTAQPRE